MSPLPNHRPKKLSLGPLETEILEIVWQLGSATVKDVHEKILADPERELAYTSVMTVLRRLTNKGWLRCDSQGGRSKKERAYRWYPRISQTEAQSLQAYDQLHRFLAISNPDLVASFADSLDSASLDQIEAIASRIEAVRRQRKE